MFVYFKLKIGTPITPALKNVYSNFVHFTSFCFRVCDRQTDKQDAKCGLYNDHITNHNLCTHQYITIIKTCKAYILSNVITWIVKLHCGEKQNHQSFRYPKASLECLQLHITLPPRRFAGPCIEVQQPRLFIAVVLLYTHSKLLLASFLALFTPVLAAGTELWHRLNVVRRLEVTQVIFTANLCLLHRHTAHWLGHTLKRNYDSIAKQALQWIPKGHRERPKNTWKTFGERYVYSKFQI